MIIHNKKEEEEKYFEPVSAWEGEKGGERKENEKRE